MEKESFEDEKVASLLNRKFVSIKVDREERPDVDSIYMKACILMTGTGGWPLTILMTPQKQPFFAGTYPDLTDGALRTSHNESSQPANELASVRPWPNRF